MLDKKNKIDKLHLKKTPVKALLEVKKKIEMKTGNTVKANVCNNLRKSSKSTPTMSFKQQGETEKQPAPFTLERDLKMITEEFKPLPRHSGMIRVNKILPVRNSISSKEDVNAFNKDCKDVIFKKMQIKKNSLPTLNKIEFPKPDKTFNHSPTQIKESSTKSNIATKTSNIILTTNYSEKEGVDKHEEGQLDSSNVILNSIQKLGKMLQGTNLKDTIIIDDDGNNNLNLIQNTHNNKNETYIEINNLLKNHDCNNETNDESEQRMKRYGILFDFINSNLKEINLLMSNEKEKDVIKKSSPFMDNPDITDSFLESCINEEFYRNLAEQTNHLDYNELSSIMSKIDATHINNKSDTTQFQFDGMHFNRRNARNRDRPNEDMFDGNITCEYVDTENEFTGTKLTMINPRTLLKLVKAEKENSQNKNKEEIHTNNYVEKSKCLIF